MKKYLLFLPLVFILLGAGCETDQPTNTNGSINLIPSVSQETAPAITVQQNVEVRPSAPAYTPTPKTYTVPAQETRCCKYCSKGKACGDSCISRSYTCHKPPGCACDS